MVRGTLRTRAGNKLDASLVAKVAGLNKLRTITKMTTARLVLIATLNLVVFLTFLWTRGSEGSGSPILETKKHENPGSRLLDLSNSIVENLEETSYSYATFPSCKPELERQIGSVDFTKGRKDCPLLPDIVPLPDGKLNATASCSSWLLYLLFRASRTHYSHLIAFQRDSRLVGPDERRGVPKASVWQRLFAREAIPKLFRRLDSVWALEAGDFITYCLRSWCDGSRPALGKSDSGHMGLVLSRPRELSSPNPSDHPGFDPSLDLVSIRISDASCIEHDPDGTRNVRKFVRGVCVGTGGVGTGEMLFAVDGQTGRMKQFAFRTGSGMHPPVGSGEREDDRVEFALGRLVGPKVVGG